MRNILAIAKRELKAYFGTPIAYVFLAIFVALTGVFTFFIGNFFGRGVADLSASPLVVRARWRCCGIGCWCGCFTLGRCFYRL